MKGILQAGLVITPTLLESLGCEKIGDNSWRLKIHGYSFIFKPLNNYWDFFTYEGSGGHAVTHLEECFGFIAADFFVAGRDDKTQESRSLLKLEDKL